MLMLFKTGAARILAKFFNNESAVGGDDLTLRLFTNDIVPADDDVPGDYTEAAGGGYAALPLVAGNWVGSMVGGIRQVAYAQQDFVFSGALTGNPDIYGYFVTDADGTLIHAERRSEPYTPAEPGDTLLVTPQFQLSKGTPT